MPRWRWNEVPRGVYTKIAADEVAICAGFRLECLKATTHVPSGRDRSSPAASRGLPEEVGVFRELTSQNAMKRVHLFEFHDLEWFPHAWRNMLTDVLSFFALLFNPFGPLVPKLKQILERLNCRNIVDLCSGASGPLLEIQRQLENKENYPVRITLTDKFPNLEAFERAVAASQGKLAYVETSVDATNVPVELEGFRTLFVSFHHFPPETARQILRDAAAKKEGIGIFEYTERSLHWPLPILLTPLFVWLVTPFLKPFTWQRLLWTYLLPVMPLVAALDGLVSCLRTYSPEELRQLTQEIPCDHYAWEIGKIRRLGTWKITCLLGYPTEPRVEASKSRAQTKY